MKPGSARAVLVLLTAILALLTAVITFGSELAKLATTIYSSLSPAAPPTPARPVPMDPNGGATTLFLELSGFQPGSYRLSSCAQAERNLAAFLADLRSRQLRPDQIRQLVITVVGVADALPFRGRRKYSGAESIENEPYFSLFRGRDDNMTLVSGRSVLNNERLAFLRAYDVICRLRSEGWLLGARLEIVTDFDRRVGETYRLVSLEVETRPPLNESGASGQLLRSSR